MIDFDFVNPPALTLRPCFLFCIPDRLLSFAGLSERADHRRVRPCQPRPPAAVRGAGVVVERLRPARPQGHERLADPAALHRPTVRQDLDTQRRPRDP